MSRRSRIGWAVSLSIAVVLLTCTAVRSQASRNPALPSVQNLAQGQSLTVGTYQLFTVTVNGKGELYRINTKTGQVWLHTEYVIPTSESIGARGAEKESLDKLIDVAAKQGKNVYTLPYWAPTEETRPVSFTIH